MRFSESAEAAAVAVMVPDWVGVEVEVVLLDGDSDFWKNN